MKLRRPSPALLIACLALFISLGGVSYGVATGFIDSREVKNNTIRTQDLRNNDIRGKDIRNSSVQGRDVAFNTLTSADVAESRLTTVPDAAKLGGVPIEGFVRSDPTGFLDLPLGTGWTGSPGGQAPQFDLDALGYVHLRGLATGAAPPLVAAVLPAGARPSAWRHFVASDPLANAPVLVTIESNGDVRVNTPGTVAFDGITFKAGG